MTNSIINRRHLTAVKLLSLTLILCLTSCFNTKTTSDSSKTNACAANLASAPVISKPDGKFEAHKTKSKVKIDGCGKEDIWSKADWYDMNYVWMGEAVDSEDYHGQFKLAWDNQHLYILVEVVDNYLQPTLKDGKENYWKGDYVEVFIDEDKSGGIHQFNHQAFAYHISTEGHAIDKSTTKETVFFDDHIEVERTQEGTKYIWEIAIKLFDKEFDENAKDNIPVEIKTQKSIGFSIAYGDNDGNNSRENFVGSKKTHGVNNDEGYVNADVFGNILFVK